jgi:hypothetical protein
MLQIKNALQLPIELLICAPISQHYDNLRCYPPLTAHFHQKNLLQIFIETQKICCSEKCQIVIFLCTLYHGNTFHTLAFLPPSS